MTAMLSRLRHGKATLADQLAFRLCGLTAFGGFALFVRWLCHLQASDPRSAASPLIFPACLGAVIVMHLGTALTFIGPDLLREATRPPRR